VVNRSGAGGTVGAGLVHRARPDGYTLLLARVGPNALVPALQRPSPYPWDGFTLLGLLELNPYVFVVRSDSPWQSLGDLVAAMRTRPGSLVYATSGPYSLLNIGVLSLLDAAGLSADTVVMLPYRGGGRAALALLGGHADFIGINLATVQEQIHGGRLRALAVSGETRSAMLPRVPTLAEAGYPQLQDLMGWSGLWGPPGLPAPVVTHWQSALRRLADDPDWLRRTREQGSLPFILDPSHSRAFVARQVAGFRALNDPIAANRKP